MEPGDRYSFTWAGRDLWKVEFDPKDGPLLYDPKKEAVMPTMLPPPGMIPIYEAHRMLMEAVAQATKPFVEAMAKNTYPVYVAMPPDQPQIERLLEGLRALITGWGVKSHTSRERSTAAQLEKAAYRECADDLRTLIKKQEGGQEHGI